MVCNMRVVPVNGQVPVRPAVLISLRVAMVPVVPKRVQVPVRRDIQTVLQVQMVQLQHVTVIPSPVHGPVLRPPVASRQMHIPCHVNRVRLPRVHTLRIQIRPVQVMEQLSRGVHRIQAVVHRRSLLLRVTVIIM